MKIITCTGYGGTGSSAITDLLKEFNNITCPGDFEFRFLQDPFGVRDLEYALIENNQRLNTDYFIKKFKKQINYLHDTRVNNYEKYFNNKFLKYSFEYIDNLIDNQWTGFWHKDIEESNFLKKCIYYLERAFQKYILKKKEGGAEYINRFLKINMYYSNPKEKFYIETKKYLKNLFLEIDKNSLNTIALDQLVPPNNIEPYFNYFEDLKVIVVDRDPRDIFLLNKMFWKELWIPAEIDTFISWYKNIRNNNTYRKNNKNILFINFEELIYSYQETLEKIYKFLDIKEINHISKKKFFNPEVSIKNTKLYINPEKIYTKDIRKIEKELKEFLYT